MMKFPNNSILVYIALGDAYCVASEYIKLPEEIDRALRSLEFKEYVDHPRYEIPKGFYTDDTEMSVANANVLLYNDQPFTVEMFAHEYVSEFNRGGRRKGYARKFQEFLEKVKNAQEFLENINPKSDRNGAAMRAVPIGALQSIDDVLGVAELQARITHNTSEGILSAQVVALAAHFALYEDEPFRRLDQYCLDNLPARSHKKYPDIFKYRWSGGAVTAKSWAPVSITTIHAVIDLLKYQTSLMDILRQIINWGGDTDSVAAIAWGIASARYQNEVLPEFMTRDLEGGSTKTGFEYLSSIGTRLMQKYNVGE